MSFLPECQYQHFVPQFLLRNFSHPYKPTGPRRRGKDKQKNGPLRGETVVRSIDLRPNEPVICEQPIKRILGQMNVYDDSTKPSLKEQRQLEEIFGKFENQVARVFSKIVKGHDEHQKKVETKQDGGSDTIGGVCLTRPERDCLRKFLFILHYRSGRLHERFNHQAASEYNANDKEFMQEHMEEKGYQRPLSVWFDNLKAIIDIDMDVEGKWREELPKRMFPDDAMGFIVHTGSYYMSICTPANPDDEFILTDNSYGVFEGPNTFTRNKETGEIEESVHCPLHYFAPVSPRLMIVCRSNFLPNPLEDADERIKECREEMRRASLDSVFSEDLIAKCRLRELPVVKARNSYSQIVDGKIFAMPGHDGTRRKTDRFVFDIFPVNSWHVNMINSILLENLGPCTSVVFNSTDSLAKTLEWYLGAPCDVAGKVYIGKDGEDDMKVEALRKLEAVSRSLGSTKKTVTGRLDVPLGNTDSHEALRKQFRVNRNMWKKLKVDEDRELREFLDMMEEPEQKPFAGYILLGGSQEKMEEDIDQARRMWNLRIKIDKWSVGVREDIRQRNRLLLEAAYRDLPQRRFFMYGKLWRATAIRHFAKKGPGQRKEPLSKTQCSGPEDLLPPMYRVIRSDRFNQLVHNVIHIDIKHQEPDSMWPDMWEPLRPWDPMTFFLRCGAITSAVNMPGEPHL
ncbi:hypothetical protein B0T14DRAFT_236244 [Immersiella caudata]|uniref:Uncharacterized protein n=1 Tax=Immersiella caudata TaxID=314043 RepID=A0AA39WSB2_9PEZI|nr:hypothetical protein B0T14DRAFT_236244 [Immersiella caudata]